MSLVTRHSSWFSVHTMLRKRSQERARQERGQRLALLLFGIVAVGLIGFCAVAGWQILVRPPRLIPVGTVADYADDSQITWSPDGTRLAYARNGAIWVVDADGTDKREIVPQVNPGFSLESPDWNRAGTRIAYLHSTGPGAATIHQALFT